MASNYEFYKDEVLNWIEQAEGNDGCVAVLYENLSGNFRGCETECRECGKVLVDFLKQEHIEQPKLTKRERALCEAVQKGWIARDADDRIHWYDNEPYKDSWDWRCNDGHLINFNPLHLFTFVRWEDEKPWSVADLLKLEVIEEVQEDA